MPRDHENPDKPNGGCEKGPSRPAPHFGQPLHVLGLLLLTALPANAFPLTCHFDTECLEGEACATTDYMFDIRSDGDGIAVDDPSGSYPGVALAPNAWSWATEFGANLLTLTGEGRARYTTHLPEADFSIHYTGTCSEAG